ncbi:MAG: hypothetical protein QNJ98_16230 [Planctomycetota bacterium]|nr:hypothetical protein [Planctomycetota bacterium]
MRFGMLIALASALVMAGCSSSRAQSTKVATAPKVAKAAEQAPAVRTVRTQTVTAMPVSKTIDAPLAMNRFMPPPAPPISEASTRTVATLKPAARQPITTQIIPASRPARSTKVIETSAKPLAPVSVPSFEEHCPGGVCGIPDPCDPCPGGVCGIPDPCDPCADGKCGIPSPCDVIDFLKKK